MRIPRTCITDTSTKQNTNGKIKLEIKIRRWWRIFECSRVDGIRTLYRIALERAGHTMTPAAALPQFKPRDGNNLHPRTAHAGDGVGVAFIRDHHPWRQSDGVIGIIPLLPLHLILVTASFNDVQFRNLEGIRDGERMSFSRVTRKSPGFFPGRRLIALTWSTTLG